MPLHALLLEVICHSLPYARLVCSLLMEAMTDLCREPNTQSAVVWPRLYCSDYQTAQKGALGPE